ncbi:M23 family metallopeptidase [Clostridium sp. D2Q-14]|uniref:M23 family metallopeptidase n=1 Tax=Anaeromonas gelatinilytica TaxID=2683194 RepID=UPI00193B7548|nr:M23 family metallopeptidase [Anaeromonas gelatinilytica]MBS4535864.1 M23 family metallopeptidase [Anaeromonas gelatinilytica]
MKNKILNRNRPRYYRTDKSKKKYYRKMFIQTLVCILVIIIIIIIKLFNIDSTNETIEIMRNNIQKDRSIKSDGIFIFNKIKEIEVLNKTFNSEDIDKDYVFPVSGTLYRDYGEYKKSDNVKVFNNGIDVITDKDYVKAMYEGSVVETGTDNRYGNFMVIKHEDYLVKYFGFESMYKEAEDKVNKGEEIGKLKNGDDKNNFRIEVYKEDESIDPLDDLKFINEDILLI